LNRTWHPARLKQAGPFDITKFRDSYPAYAARVLLPMIAPEHYTLWLGIAQAASLIAFGLFVRVYAPMLVKPRTDGQPG
jgi:uncharacterized protein involved in response to NO